MRATLIYQYARNERNRQIADWLSALVQGGGMTRRKRRRAKGELAA